MKTNILIGSMVAAALVIIVSTSLFRREPPAVPATAPVAVQPTLASMALDMMELPRCKGASKDVLSAARRTVLANQIDRILTSTGGSRETQETFVLLLCIETKFRAGLKSPAGAMGIAQLMPATARAEAKAMGLGELNNDDLMDTELNLMIGYKHFLGLVEMFGGNHAKAAAAYNGGSAGSTVKGLSNGTAGAAETDKYVRDMFYLQEARRVAQGGNNAAQ